MPKNVSVDRQPWNKPRTEALLQLS
jgi:hypothetical protein